MSKEETKEIRIDLTYGFYIRPGYRGTLQLHRTTVVEQEDKDGNPTGNMVEREMSPSYHGSMEQAVMSAAKMIMNGREDIESGQEHIEERTRIYNNMLQKVTSDE